jgi:NAD(P)-dependent dehydrogenase (short-subunit alcohol dehydrogenase family)
MTDEASVEAASKEFQEGKLDVLVNCAGSAYLRTTPKTATILI